jgi:hypothetical protein
MYAVHVLNKIGTTQILYFDVNTPEEALSIAKELSLEVISTYPYKDIPPVTVKAKSNIVPVKLSKHFMRSKLLGDIVNRGHQLCVDTDTGYLFIQKQSKPQVKIKYYPEGWETPMFLSTSLSTAVALLDKYPKGTITCEAVRFSVYYSGTITPYVTQLWERVRDYMARS